MMNIAPVTDDGRDITVRVWPPFKWQAMATDAPGSAHCQNSILKLPVVTMPWRFPSMH